MSNAKIKVGVLSQIKAFFANTKKDNKGINDTSAPVNIVEYVEPEPSEEEKLQAFLTEEETLLLEEDKRHIGVNKSVAKEALKEAKIAAAIAKLKSDSAARVAKSKFLANDAIAKAEKAVLEDLVETQKLADRVADYSAEEALSDNRIAAIRDRRIYDMEIVAAHMAGDTDRAEQARQAAILLAGRNTAAPVGGKSYNSNAGTNSSTQSEKPSTEKKEPKAPKAKAALIAAGFPEAQAERVLKASKSADSVAKYAKAISDKGRGAEVSVIASILCNPAHDYFANNWSAYVAGTLATTTTNSAPVGYTLPAPAGNSTTPSTEGTGVTIPSGVGDIVDNTAE